MNHKRKKLKDLYSITNSVFTDLQTLQVPWQGDNIAQKLDIAYMTNQSGNKFISPLVENFIDEEGEISAQDRGTIASVIFAMYNDNWTKLYNTLSFEYNPIENYSMLETMTNDRTVTQYGRTDTRTDNLSHTKTGTEATGYASTETRTDNLTHTKGGSETLTHNTTDTRTDNLTHTKGGSETLTHNTTDTRTDNLRNTKNGSESVTHNTQDTRTDNLQHTYEGGESNTPATSVKNAVYAFNSSTPSPTSVSSNEGVDTKMFINRNDKQTGTETNSKTGTDTTDYNNIVEKNEGTQATTKTGTETTSFANRTDTDTGTSANAKTGTETTSFTDRVDTDAGTSANAHTGTDTLTHNTTEADTGTQANVQSGSDTATRNYSLSRTGNIGTMSTQNMIEQERKIWLWKYFFDVVFPDVDRMLTLNIY